MKRTSDSTGTPWELVVGYSRAVRVGSTIHVFSQPFRHTCDWLRATCHLQPAAALVLQANLWQNPFTALDSRQSGADTGAANCTTRR